MRIRLFENHLEDYYQKVEINTMDEINKLNKEVDELGEWFSKKEYGKILNLISDYLGFENINSIIHTNCNKSNMEVRFQFVSLGFKVIKMEDEWYYVNFYDDNNTDVYYKCDQFEGLEQLFINCDEMKEIKKYIKNNIDNEEYN